MCLPADRNEQHCDESSYIPLTDVFPATALRLLPPARPNRAHRRPPLLYHRQTVERQTSASATERAAGALNDHGGDRLIIHEINLVVDNYLRTVTVVESPSLQPRNRHPYTRPVGEITITMRRDDSGPRRPVAAAGTTATLVRLFVAFAVVLAATKLLANATTVVAAASAGDVADDYSPSTPLLGQEEAHARIKRQLPPIEQGNQVIDDIFQIPITTLNAVGSLIKSTRPLVRRTRERIQQLYYGGQQQQQVSAVVSQYQQQRPQYTYNNRRPVGQSSYFGGSNNRRRPSREYDDNALPQGRLNNYNY